jgi:aminoglycoside phosphotransferase family enzyme
MGFTIDGHGDLHSRNIFLLDEPVIFDCIEFNDHFRQVDVLSEIAFFCMDLDFYEQKELEAHFLKNYLIKYPCIFTDEDRLIFQFYKLYRANVRTKVNALKAIQTKDKNERSYRLNLAEDYFLLMREYLSILQEKEVSKSKSDL